MVKSWDPLAPPRGVACCVAQMEPGLLRQQNLDSQGGGVPTPGTVDRLDGLLPALGRRRETQPSGPFQRDPVGSSGHLLAELLRAGFSGAGGGEPSFSGGLCVIFLEVSGGAAGPPSSLGPPASWGTSLESNLTHRPFRRAGLAPRSLEAVWRCAYL